MTATETPTQRKVRHKVIAGALALALVATVVVVAIFLVDQFNGGPSARDAAEQGLQNGENLCDFALVTSDALIALAGPPELLTVKQSTKLHAMRHVARHCRATPPPTEGD